MITPDELKLMKDNNLLRFIDLDTVNPLLYPHEYIKENIKKEIEEVDKIKKINEIKKIVDEKIYNSLTNDLLDIHTFIINSNLSKAYIIEQIQLRIRRALDRASKEIVDCIN